MSKHLMGSHLFVSSCDCDHEIDKETGVGGAHRVGEETDMEGDG
jgi:hypothetical protein